MQGMEQLTVATPEAQPADRARALNGRFFRNVDYKFASGIWLYLVLFVTTPLLAHALGVVNYGIYAVSISVAGIFTIFDFNLGAGIMRFVARLCKQR